MSHLMSPNGISFSVGSFQHPAGETWFQVGPLMLELQDQCMRPWRLTRTDLGY